MNGSRSMSGRKCKVVGGGILGFTLALRLAREDADVELYEQSLPEAFYSGRYRRASPAAFAMVVPSSMGFGPGRDIAVRALAGWRALVAALGLSKKAFNETGWMACATSKDGADALDEYFQSAGRAWGATPLSKATIGADPAYAAINGTEVQFALFDPHAASVHPSTALSELQAAAARFPNLRLSYGVQVRELSKGAGVIVDLHGTTSKVAADAWFIASGNYMDLFPRAYAARSPGFRVLQMARSSPFPKSRLLPWMISGDTTIIRYGFAADTAGAARLRKTIPADVLEIDANLLITPHLLDDGGFVTLGDTHHLESDSQPVDLRHLEILRREALRIMRPELVPQMSELTCCYTGMYPYFADQGPHGETPVILCPPDELAVLLMATKGRGWTVAPEVAELAVAEWLNMYG